MSAIHPPWSSAPFATSSTSSTSTEAGSSSNNSTAGPSSIPPSYLNALRSHSTVDSPSPSAEPSWVASSGPNSPSFLTSSPSSPSFSNPYHGAATSSSYHGSNDPKPVIKDGGQPQAPLNMVTLYMLYQQGLISKAHFDSLTLNGAQAFSPSAPAPFPPLSTAADTPYSWQAPSSNHGPGHSTPTAGSGPSSGAFTQLATKLASSLPHPFPSSTYPASSSSAIPAGAIQAVMQRRLDLSNLDQTLSHPSSSAFPSTSYLPPESSADPTTDAAQDERISAELLALQIASVLESSAASSSGTGSGSSDQSPASVPPPAATMDDFTIDNLFTSSVFAADSPHNEASPESQERADLVRDLPPSASVNNHREERRGRTRTAGSTSESPEAVVELNEDFAMDWRAKSKSRSRSRANDVMDWRAQSRSRSRAPEFRLPIAVPPTLSPAVATARFAGEGPSVNPTPTTSTLGDFDDFSSLSSDFLASFAPSTSSSQYPSVPSTAPLPPVPPTSYQSTPLSILSSTPAVQMPSYLSSSQPRSILSPISPASTPGPFAFPSEVSSPVGSLPALGSPPADPNLAAIENTLNQLISLQLLAANSPKPGSPDTSPGPFSPLSATFASSTASPSSMGTAGFAKNKAPTASGVAKRERLSSIASDAQAAGGHSLAHQALQQLAAGRKLGHQTTTSASYPRPSSSATTSSPYLNAANLAQASRPFSFSQASGLSLNRPSQLPTPDSVPSTPTPQLPTFSPPGTPSANLYSSSAPAHYFVNSPYDLSNTPSYYAAGSPYSEASAATPLSLDAFGFDSLQASQSLYSSFNPVAPTHINPSQLLNTHLYPAAAPSDWDVASSWGFSPISATNSSSRTGTPSPPDPPGSVPTSLNASTSSLGHSVSRKGAKPRAAPPEKPATFRSNSSPDLVAANRAAKGKTVSAPTSRNHSRSNTLQMPPMQPTVLEGQALVSPALGTSGFMHQAQGHHLLSQSQPASGPGSAALPPTGLHSVTTPSDGSSTPAGSGGTPEAQVLNGTELRCLNCSTVNTPLWRRDADGRPLCNACGLFRNLHGVDRPANLNTGVIKKRNRTRGGPKDGKKGSRSNSRRNSTSGTSPPAAPKARANSTPYPTAANRASNE